MWWDFVSLRPEATMHTMHLFSDLGRPDGFRRMDGFGVHAFKLVNKNNNYVFCKFHWRSLQPGRALTFQEAAQLAGTNPEYKTQDLFDAIAGGDYPSWNLYVQVMTQADADKHPRNPFDITRTWREEDYPLIQVGRMTLNRNPANFFAEMEQSAFAPSNMVPGIEPSPDRMLAGRLFAYQDAQRYRLGVNFPMLPVNRPVTEVNSYTRDGQSCHGTNGGSSVNYFPNSFGGSEPDILGGGQLAFNVGGKVERNDIPEDEHIEPRMFLDRDVDPEQRRRLVDSLADHLKNAKSEIRERVLKTNFDPISKTFGEELRAAVEMALKQ